MKYDDVMVDLETLGCGNNAIVIQIGAVYFNRETGELGDIFKANIDIESEYRAGFDITGSTIYWWLEQSEAARKSVIAKPRVACKDAWESFNTYLKDVKNIWSHATFDFCIVKTHFEKLGIFPSFSYRAPRDIRTLTELVGMDARIYESKFVGTPHDGVDDAKYQVIYCVDAMNRIKEALING